MKKFLLLIMIAGFIACVKKDRCRSDNGNFESEGVITGADMRMCVCQCGGYFIEIDGQTLRFMEEFLPPNDLDLSHDNLPLKVRLDWDPNTSNNPCGAKDLITVLRIEAQRR
jgi:hypothetical protein